jgi:hypothetical protein
MINDIGRCRFHSFFGGVTAFRVTFRVHSFTTYCTYDRYLEGNLHKTALSSTQVRGFIDRNLVFERSIMALISFLLAYLDIELTEEIQSHIVVTFLLLFSRSCRLFRSSSKCVQCYWRSNRKRGRISKICFNLKSKYSSRTSNTFSDPSKSYSVSTEIASRFL